MSIKEQFRYNASQKEYQIISDFSKGMNTADGDSILTDNTARNVTNFDIDAGAILTKRHGMSPLKPVVNSFYELMFNKTTVDSGEDYQNLLICVLADALKTSPSFTIQTHSATDEKASEQHVELEKKYINVMEFIRDFISKSTITPEELAKDDAYTFIASENNNAWFTLAKRLYNYLKIKNVNHITTPIDAIVYEMEANDLLTKTLKFEYAQGIPATIMDVSDEIEYLINPLKPATPENVGTYNFSSKLEALIALIAVKINCLINFIPNFDDSEVLITSKIFTILSNAVAYKQFVKITNNLGTKYVLSVKLGDAETTIIIHGFFEFLTVEQGASDSSIYFNWYRTDDKDYLYVPDIDTFNDLSYNLLALNNTSLDDVYQLKSALFQFVDVPMITNQPEVIKPLLLNYPLPYITPSYGLAAQDRQIKLAYLIGLSKPDLNTQDYWVGYQLVPLTVWTAQQYQPDTFASGYIPTVVSHAMIYTHTKLSEPTNPIWINGVKQRTLTYPISINLKTTEPQVLQVFAFKAASDNVTEDLKLIKSPAELLTTILNINPVQENINNRFSAALITENFSKTDKDLFYKNQIFRYGNSNTIFISDINNPDYFPMNNYLTLPTQQEVVSIVPYYNQLLVQTKTQQFIIEGNTPTDFKIKDLNSDIGAIAPYATKPNINYVFQLSTAGVYRTKSMYNFADRYNADKMDNPISGDIALDKNACAIVHDDKYYLHTPSTGDIWIYYNQFNSWVRHTSTLFKFKGIFNIYEKLVFAADDVPGLGIQNNEWVDRNFDNEYPVISTYKSKEVDFGLPNHDKKFKEMHVAFEDTPKANAIYVNAWVDGSQVISYRSDELVSTATTNIYGQPDVSIERKVVETNQIETLAQAQYDNGNFDKALFDNDQNQQHKVIISGRGKALQFEVVHKENKQMKIRNFGTVIKVKKPKARFKE